MNYGVASMTAALRRVALRKPGESIQQADAKLWNYGSSFDRRELGAEHAAFTGLLESAGVEILWLDGDDRGNADAVFTYDASLVTPVGAILMNPGKPLRTGEQALHSAFYEAQEIPVIGEISGEGHAEAGDTLWLDAHTLAVGRGFRTNPAGISQLEALLAPIGIEVHAFDLPVYYGASACLHLMSLVSLVDTRLAAVTMPLLPVGLYRLMQQMDYRFIDISRDEFERSGTLSANILALGPGRCIMVDGYPETRLALESAGIEISVFGGQALCVGCEGGPTCMSRPILRDDRE
jgi:N-dimethylarginine dimethylaminohydrolase